MKKTLILLAVVSAVSGPVFAMGDSPQTLTEYQKTAIAELERKQTLRKKGKCSDTELLVDIDGYTLKVPREYYFFFDDNTEMSGSEMQYRCDIKRIKTSRGFWSPTLGVSSGQSNTSKIHTIKLHKKIEKYHERKELQKGGVTEIAEKYYLLPLEQAPTADNMQVVFECDNPQKNWAAEQYSGGCRVGYRHPLGLNLSYRVTTGGWMSSTKRLISAGDLIEYDRQQRKRLEDMIIRNPEQEKEP